MALQTQEFKLRRRTPMSGRTLVSPVPDGIRARIETASFSRRFQRGYNGRIS